MYCRWFVKCEDQAVGMAAHPVFTAIPICERCATKLGIKIPLRVCKICGSDVAQGEEVCSEKCLNLAKMEGW